MKLRSFFVLVSLIIILTTSCNITCDCDVDPYRDMVTEYDLKKSIIQINSVNFATGLESYFDNLIINGSYLADSSNYAHMY